MRLSDYIKQIESAIRERKGNVPAFLYSTIKGAAMTEMIGDKIFGELSELSSMTILEAGSMGQQKQTPHPLIDKFKANQALLLQYNTALGLTLDSNPDKVEGNVSAKEDVADPLVQLLQSRK